jgi:hypothetical protein
MTELGLLRLPTNRHVMGEDVLAPRQAWLCEPIPAIEGPADS